MSHVYVKVPLTRRGYFQAWASSTPGAPSLTPNGHPLSTPEADELELMERQGRENIIGAGGQFEYRKLRQEGERIGYFVVVQPGPKIRAQFPGAVRLLDVRSGDFYGLFDSGRVAREALSAGTYAGQLAHIVSTPTPTARA